MSFQKYLTIDGMELPLPMSYKLDFRDIESDTSGETEAGTIQRDVVRTGVVSIKVAFNCSPAWVKKFSKLNIKRQLSVEYFNTLTLDSTLTTMYMDNFSVELVKDTSFKGLWEVSFVLNEF